MKIRIFADFCDSAKTRQQFIQMYGDAAGDLITADNDYTHVIIINCAMPNIPDHIDKKNVIGFANEPNCYLNLTHAFVEYAEKHIGRYFISDTSRLSLPPPFEEGYGFIWHKTLSHIPALKTNASPISLMISEKKGLSGYNYRALLAEHIITRNLPIDIWGRGVPELQKIYGDRPQLKRMFGEEETVLYDGYKFSIAIENTQANMYVTEKFTNCLITGTVPIYLGCPNIDALFGKQCCIKLKGNIEEDIALLEDICKSPDSYTMPVNVNVLHESPAVNLYKAIIGGQLFTDTDK